MDVLEFIKTGGRKTIPNPDYNPRSKKNKGPKTIDVIDLGPDDNNPLYNLAKTDLENRWSVSADELEKYGNYGINYNPREAASGELDRLLAERQGAMTKLGNSVAQAVVSEVGLGTAKGITDLFDVFSGAVFRSDNDYSNPASEYLEQLQEDFRNKVAPIYTDPNKNIGNGGLLDAGWWASNLPSVMSSLTLMIPSTGITKGLSWLGRGLNLASKGKLASFGRGAYKVMTGARKAKTAEDAAKLNGFTKWLNNPNTMKAASRMGETTVNAALMRTMENYQESRQVYNDMKKQALDKFNNISDEEYNNIISQNADKLEDVDTSDKEAVAERLASLSADRTFLMDYANTFFDVVQLNALRNPIKLLKNMRGTRAINKAQRESIKNTLEAAGVKATEAAEKAGLASTTKNFGRGIKDFLKDSGVAVKAELSEGVEEAVNYIAQEEGMHFGNVALGEDVDKGFKSRLGSYMRSPELYDAAFWGVMGGIVFQGLGSGFNRLSVAAERAYQNKKNKTNEKTGEATNKESWQELFETSENKRRVSAINKNVEDFNTLIGRLKQIGTEEEPGTDPFNVGEDKKPIPLTSNIERSLARERAIDEYITGMTFRAMDNGNFDMLKAYLQDDEIQKVLNQVTGNENDGGAFVQSLVDRMDNIADKYNENLIALSNIATNVNIKGTDNIPIEYLQIIARDNTYNQIKLERVDSQIGAYETSAANKEAQYGNKLDKSLNYKDTVQLVVLTKNLAELKERKAELENDKENKGYGKQIELDDINRKIRIVEDMIKGSKETSNSDSLTRLLYSTIQANLINDADLYAQNLTDLISGNIAGILGEERAKEFETSDIELMKVLGEDRQSGSYKTLASDINSVFEGEYGLNKIDKRLGDDYYMLAALNMEKQSINQNIIMNEKNLSEKVNELHNSMLESRVNAINKAGDNLKQLARKYGRETIANNLESGAEINWQTEQDKSLFNDSLEILNLTSSSNQKLYSNIQDMLFFDELISASQEENNEDGENSSTSENQNAGSQNGGSNNQFGQNAQTNENGETTLNGEENNQGQPQAEQKQINEEDNKAATETVNNLRGKSFKKLTDDELNEVLDEINSHLTPEKSISDYNRQQLNVHKARLKKEINNRKNSLESKTDKELIDRYNSMSGASNSEELEELQNITKELNRRGIDPATISSTGGQVANPTTPAKKEQKDKTPKQFDEFGNPIKDPNRAKVESEISKELTTAAKNAKANNTDVAAAVNAKIQELNTKYGDDEEYKKHINRMAHWIAVRAEKSGLTSDVANIVLLASSIEERGGKYQFVGDYLKQTEEFVDKFLKAANAKSFNGKRLVSFEAILRFANEQMEDPTTAQYIYGMMKSWFKDGPNKDKYIVLENMDSTSIFDRTSKTDKELVEERLGGTSIFRVEINKFLKSDYSKKAFDELNVGDELQVEVLDDDIVLMHNGVAIGRLPQPAISSLGGFTQVNDGWITDVSLEQGNVVSRLRKVWEDILLNNTPINNKINSYIYQIIGANKTNSNVNEIRKAIENDKELTDFFKGLKKEGIVEGTASNIKLINGLVSIWNYIDLTHPDQAKREELINLSLDLWFNKLYDTYTKITNTNTLGAKNFKFTVTKVTDGDIIQVANNNPNGYNECTLGKDNDAIADIDNTQIGVINFGSFGVIQTTTNEKVSQPSSGPGSIWAVFPNRSGIPGIIRGHSLRFNDDDPKIKDTAAGRIKEAIINEFENRIRNIETDDDINGLFNFIDQCFGKRLGTPLLASIGGGTANVQIRKDAKRGDRLQIGIKLNKTDYLNFTINQDSRAYNFSVGAAKSNYKSIDEIDDFIKDFKEQVLDNATFNAAFDYFKSDANPDTPLDGLATRDRDGNFVIAIPNSKDEPLIETFPSFKHFMFQGGAARWNTKNVDGSNYQAKSEAQVRNRVLNVSIEQQSSRPVEEISPSTITPESVNEGTAIDTLIEQHFGKNSSAVKRLQELGLIPSKIIYTKETLMKGDHPSHIWTSISKKEIYVDDEFIKTMNENQDMAIRKLIHEQLHLKLHSKGNRRKELLNRISEIVNDFKTALDNDSSANPHLREYLFEHINNNEERLEEFLVESLTNRELASYLNSKQVESPTNKTKQSIFDKILKLLADIFDWRVTEGSLYEKELRVLQGFTNGNQNTKQPTVREGTLDFKEDEEQNVQQEEQNVQQEETSTEGEESEDEFDEDDVVASSVREVTVSPTISAEMQSIKERAIADGTFMKAPNGNPTNLTERQWLQVRTKNFINWFGDWINDPANASKVVDENGEPKVMYHATPWGKFSIFKQFQPNTGDRTKAGELYFGNSKRMVQRYTRGEFNKGNSSPEVYAVFLNIRNPYKNAEVINKQQLDDILEDLKNYLTPKEFESIQNKVYDDWNTDEKYNFQYHSYYVYNTLANYFKNNNKDRFYEVVRNLRNSGHKDGMFFLTKEEWEGQPINFREGIKRQVWVMDPNQIKSATDNNGEFSTENDDIRASSVQETTAPSINQFVESLPLEERINFDKLLIDGTISMKCS